MQTTLTGTDAEQRGQAIYDETLKSVLEPTRNGEVVAIHLSSGDYLVARNGTAARRLLRKQHPDGIIYSLWIGPVSASEINFAHHLRSNQKP